jgi:hypothetical protein
VIAGTTGLESGVWQMKLSMFSRHNAIDETHLQQAGFTVDEIVLLAKLRQNRPLLEELVSRRERYWLEFMKWCYATGRLHD